MRYTFLTIRQSPDIINISNTRNYFSEVLIVLYGENEQSLGNSPLENWPTDQYVIEIESHVHPIMMS